MSFCSCSYCSQWCRAQALATQLAHHWLFSQSLPLCPWSYPVEVARRTLFPYRLSQECDWGLCQCKFPICTRPGKLLPAGSSVCWAGRVLWALLGQAQPRGHSRHTYRASHFCWAYTTVVTHIVCLLWSVGVSPTNVGFQGFPQIRREFPVAELHSRNLFPQKQPLTATAGKLCIIFQALLKLLNELSVLHMQVWLQVKEARLLKNRKLSITGVVRVVVVCTLIASSEELCIVSDV